MLAIYIRGFSSRRIRQAAGAVGPDVTFLIACIITPVLITFALLAQVGIKPSREVCGNRS